MEEGDKRKGNQFWKKIDPEDLGRNPKYKEPIELWEDAEKYFKECDSRPLLSREYTESQKGTFNKTTEHAIPYTWEGLYVFLSICNLKHYKEKEAFSPIIEHIGNVIRNQKFVGAAAGLFNSNIIARDLGLTDKKDVTSDGKGLEPPQINIINPIDE